MPGMERNPPGLKSLLSPWKSCGLNTESDLSDFHVLRSGFNRPDKFWGRGWEART
jgi:hypothetical protein